MNRNRLIYFIAEFLIALIVTLPFYTASVYAGINSISVKGSSNVEHLVKPKDVLNFDVKASIAGNSTITNKQVILGSNLSFDSCSASANGQTECKLKFPSTGEFTFSHVLFPYSIRLFRSNGVLEDTKTGTVLVDNQPPSIQVSIPKSKFSSKDNITINYDATDAACSDAACAGKCSGIGKIDFAAFNNSFRQSVSIPVNDTSCQIRSSIGMPAKNFADGTVRISALASDKFGQLSNNASVSFSVDNTPPTILTSSFSITRKGIPLSSYSRHDIPVEVWINISAGDLDFNSVTADLSSLNTAAGMKNAKAACIQTANPFNVCKWSIAMNPSSGTANSTSSSSKSAIITAFDVSGNSANVSVSKSLALDDKGPAVNSIASELIVDGKHYARASGNKIIAMLEEATGIEKESIFLKMGNSRIQATSCIKESSWKCVWENVNFAASQNISISPDSTDILLNPVNDSKSLEVIVDAAAPELTYVNATPKGLLTDIHVDLFKVEDKIAIVANITEENKLAATGDFSNFIKNARNVAGSCKADEDKKGNWQCTWLSDPINIAASGAIRLNFSDPVNNALIYSIPITAFELDTLSPPDYWRSKADCSPKSVDRQLGTFINQRVYCQVALVPNQTSPRIIPLLISQAACTSKSALIDKYETISQGSQSTTPLLKFTLKKDELKIDEINITCGFNIHSRVGERVTKNPEIEITNITIKLYNLPLGEISDEVQKKIDEAKEDARGVSKVIGSLKTIIDYAKKICQMYGVIYNVIAIKHTIVILYKGTVTPAVCTGTLGTGCTAAMVKDAGLCFSQQSARKAAETGFKKAANQFCQFVNCQWAPGPLGKWQEFMRNKVDSLPGARRLPGADSIGRQDLTFQPDGELKGGLSSYMDPNNNLIVASLFGCIPGVITGLDKFRQVRCLYADCLMNAVGKDGLPLQACENQKNYAYCKYVTGELFAVIPYTAVFDYMTGLVKNALTNPFELAGVAAGIYCQHTCVIPGTSAYTACETFKLFSQIGLVAGSIQGMYKDGFSFKPKQDYCSRLNLDEGTPSGTTESSSASSSGTSGTAVPRTGSGTTTSTPSGTPAAPRTPTT